MNRFLTGLALLALVDVASQVYLTTCARMDVPLLKGAANTACVAACAIKKCGSGYCRIVKGRKTCLCRGCPRGNIPLEVLLKGR
ncbi:hypothetical protein Y032_0378g311 [Ancylostoma ceylanicum]|nr:hypothetical protein Y032_0378g311 [Ancylostoma ceylanicum]